jgi:diguanylate cyclase (GGDEF)-like protein
MENRAAETIIVTSLRDELQICLTPEEIEQAMIRHIARILPSAKIAVLAVNESQQTLEIGASSGSDTRVLDHVSLNACCGLRSGRARRRKPGVSEIECGHFVGVPPQNYLCIPMSAQGQTLGVLYVGYPDTTDAAQLDDRLDFLQRTTELGSIWIAKLILRIRLEQESIRDGLTGLFNRRFMEISLERELHLASRSRNELSLLILDLDHFKNVNDTFGHDAGDQVLREVAEILRESVRAEDIVCRYGGEEFLIILPGLEKGLAAERAEIIRERIGKMRIDFRGEALKDMTISIGVSTYPHAGHTMEELIGAADRALYNAKASGRNRVIIANSVIAA